MKKEEMKEKILKSNVIKGFLLIISVIGIVFIILSTSMCPITPFSYPNMCSEAIIDGYLGFILSVIGGLLSIIGVILLITIMVLSKKEVY